jgi:HD superfamily phosphohydrolase
MNFSDLLYGKIELPDWLGPFIKSPEFSRLRGVRLSNVDSLEFKDFNNARRWEHCIGVAYLALSLARTNKMSLKDEVQITLAALFHDIATPPFAHTIEYVIENYSHENESQKILSASTSEDSHPTQNIFKSELSQFLKLCEQTSKKLQICIDPEQVASYIIGEGEHGHFIKGTIDLDNIDNVSRASMLMGIQVDRRVPRALTDWLASYGAAPTDIESNQHPAVVAWLGYRNQMYRLFFESSDIELGRQAFLQHILRRALAEGFPRRKIIWNTDEELLFDLKNHFDKMGQRETRQHKFQASLNEVIYRYKLLEDANKVVEVTINDKLLFEKVKNPRFSTWLEQKISSPSFEPFVLINKKRFGLASAGEGEPFSPREGSILIFKLGNAILKFNQLPEWLQEELPKDVKDKKLNELVGSIVKAKLNEWAVEKPWLDVDEKRRNDIIDNLSSVGEWSFRLSKNEGIHSYPGTYVHAIPANIIMALGLKGEKIWDPFGGTGQTAAEGAKLGCSVISSDSNTIASMVAKGKLTYLSKPVREYLRNGITRSLISKASLADRPQVPDLFRWHHSNTIQQLRRIKGFISAEKRVNLRNFLLTSFSDILKESTERRGKEHGYFADNTPLPANVKTPTPIDAIDLFLKKIEKNVRIIERFYAEIERNELKVKDALSSVRVEQFDVTKDDLTKVGIEQGQIAAIITSPPYLCMADYSLGQRLSYYWISPEDLEKDFNIEIGARRTRGTPEKALQQYLENFRLFARNSFVALRSGGLLASVLGVPEATSFRDANIFNKVDIIFSEQGFEKIWSTMRPINWNRNHGYSHLKSERISVYKKK